MSPFDDDRTISLRHHNGSLYDLGMIAGNSQYRHLMLQLYKESQKAQACNTESGGESAPANIYTSNASVSRFEPQTLIC